MLEILDFSTPREEEDLLLGLNPSSSVLVCSNLRTKKDLQKKWITKFGWVPGDSVQRAGEFWFRVYQNRRPQEKSLGSELGPLYFSNFMRRHPETAEMLKSTKGLEDRILEVVSQMLPVFVHPRSDEVLSEWVVEGQLSEDKRAYLDVSKKFYEYIRSLGEFSADWCPYLLSEVDGWWSEMSGPVYFHLHGDMSLQEAELIGTLSRYHEVGVFMPSRHWRDNYPKLFRSYKVLESYQHQVKPRKESIKLCDPVAGRYASTLSESKDVVSEIRKFLDQGGSPSEIVVLAPQIETYWLELKELLKSEGVPVAKSELHRLQSFYDVQVFLGKLRTALRRYSSEDAELAIFSSPEQQEFYSDFKQRAGVLLEWSDLRSLSFLESGTGSDIDLPDRMTRDIFFDWVIGFWPKDGSFERATLLFQEFLAQVPNSLDFSPLEGCGFLERLASQIEVSGNDGWEEGVVFDNLGASSLGGYKKIICMGLAQESLDASSRFLLSPQDTFSLETKWGVMLEHAHFEGSDYTLEWVRGHQGSPPFFGYSEVDSTGRVLSPSWPWLQFGRDVEKKTPGPTCWDLLRMEGFSSEIESHVDRGSGFYLNLLRDKGADPRPVHFKSLRLSPSSFEDYHSCPYVFLAKRGFSLGDDPEVQFDPSPMEQGSLRHKMLEILIEMMEGRRPSKDLEAVFDDAISEIEWQPVEASFWQHQKKASMDFLARFHRREVAWRKQHPLLKTIATELKISGFFDPRLCQFVKEDGEGRIPFYGLIDRVDGTHDGEIVVYDYKGSVASYEAFPSWMEKGRLQLMTYALAIEAGLSSLGECHLSGGFYFGLRPLGQLKGFELERASGKLFPASTKGAFSEAQWLDVKKHYGEFLGTLVTSMTEGRFGPKPLDEKNCQSCRWRDQCRATHLM